MFSCDVINIWNVKLQSPWAFSFLWLLSILNTSLFGGFQLNSNLHFYCIAFWISEFSRHRASSCLTECVTYWFEKKTYSVIFSKLNSRGIVKTFNVNIILLVQKGEQIVFYSRSEFQMFLCSNNAILIQKFLALICTVMRSQIWHSPQIFSGTYNVITIKETRWHRNAHVAAGW